MKVKITQIKSAIGYRKRTKDTLIALGLTKMNQSVDKKIDSAIQGMINVVKHLVKVEEVKWVVYLSYTLLKDQLHLKKE